MYVSGDGGNYNKLLEDGCEMLNFLINYLRINTQDVMALQRIGTREQS